MKRKDDATVIVRMDGGICSQLLFIAYGRQLELRGYNVKYDLTWYKNWGKSDDGHHARNYELPKALPQIRIIEATSEEIHYYHTKYHSPACPHDKVTPPAYVDGYPQSFEDIFRFRDYYVSNFEPEDQSRIAELKKKILETESCAVHVRRGDLSGSTPLGDPCSVDYFLKAIRMMQALVCNPHFFFFSDEPEWVRKEIIAPHLAHREEVSYTVCDVNGPESGFLDLYLMTHAKHFICSIGSAGKMAKLLQKQLGGYTITAARGHEVMKHFAGSIIYFEAPYKPVSIAPPPLYVPPRSNSRLKRALLKFGINLLPTKRLRRRFREKLLK